MIESKSRFNTMATFELRSNAFAANGIEYTPDENKAYFEFTMVNSWPAVNGNVHGFSGLTLDRSYETARFNEINHNHQSEGNGIPLYNGNQVIGAMIDSYVADSEGGGKELRVVGVLWKRHDLAREVISDISTGGKQWKVSMEVLYDQADSGYMVKTASGDKFIPDNEAPQDLKDAYANRNPEWNGQEYAYMLGGTGEVGDPNSPNVNFWGSAVTLRPADEGAVIHSLVASKVHPLAAVAADGAYNIIIASTGKPEETVLIVDGVEIGNIQDVEFFSWLGYEAYLYWNLQPDEVGNAERRQSFVYTGSKIEEVAFMKSVRETLASLPDLIAAKVAEAKASAKEGVEVNVDEIIKAEVTAVAEKFEGFVSPDDLDVKVKEGVDAELAKREEDAKILEAREKAFTEKTQLPLTDSRKTKLASFETDDEVTAWIDGIIEAHANMVKELTNDGEIELPEEITTTVASLDDPEGEAFKALGTAVASFRTVQGFYASQEQGGDDSQPGDNSLSGLM